MKNTNRFSKSRSSSPKSDSRPPQRPAGKGSFRKDSRSPHPARGPRVEDGGGRSFGGQQRASGPAKGEFAYEKFPRHWRVVVGTHAIREVLSVRPKAIEQAWFQQGFESNKELKELHKDVLGRGIKPELKPEGLLEKIAKSHQGALVLVSQKPEIEWDQIYRKPSSKIMVLDGIEDPHNLGAILRTSWLMSVDGVLIPEDRAVGLSSTVHKVACGGVEHVPVEPVVSFAKPIEELKKQGYWVFGLSHLGKRQLFDLDIPEKVVWCVGSEDKGMRSTTERLCDELVQIPQLSAAASYNASVAAAIALTETYRQQSQKKV